MPTDFHINDTVIIKDNGLYYEGIGTIAFIREDEPYPYCVKLIACGKHIWCKKIVPYNG